MENTNENSQNVPSHRSAFHHIQRASLILIAGTLAGNLVSFGKSMLIAMYFGTSAELDAYFLSLAPMRLISGILIGGVQAALIPYYLDVQTRRSHGYAFSLFVSYSSWILAIAGVLMCGLWLGSPWIAAALGLGFSKSLLGFTTTLIGLSALLLACTLLNDLGNCLFNAQRWFWLSAFLPLVGGILSSGILVVFHGRGVRILMDGLIGGMIVQNGIMLFAARRLAPAQVRWLSPTNDDIRKIFTLMLPLLIGASLGHVNMVVDQMMASTLSEGSIAALQYANKLHTVLTQMFIMMVSTAILPFLSTQVAENRLDDLKATFRLTITRTLMILLPISIVIAFLGKPFVQIVFQRGEFSAQSTQATTQAWIAYSVGLPFMAVGILTARVYNALRENTTLMYISGGSIVLNVVFNWIFMKSWGHVGIALSTSVVYLLTMIILLSRLQQRIGLLWP